MAQILLPNDSKKNWCSFPIGFASLINIINGKCKEGNINYSREEQTYSEDDKKLLKSDDYCLNYHNKVIRYAKNGNLSCLRWTRIFRSDQYEILLCIPGIS